ncbi:uncharacterized protein E1O_27590 [Burkholderiales bacterium GJ-E10]|nr:uncharacterized protein E1O_27590 [Burkholderiales bacterium GJ-E10]
MRRAALFLSLLFLLLAAQTTGLVHEIGHGLGGGEVARSLAAAGRAQAGRSIPQAASCDKCFQYAQIAGLTTASVIAFAGPDSDVESARAATFAWLPAVAPTSRSRDPPAVL